MKTKLLKSLSVLRLIWFSKPVVQIKIIQRDPLRVTMREWRSSPDMVRQSAQALANPTIRQMIDICRLNHIGQWALDPSISLNERAIRSAMNEGYGLGLNDFEALGTIEKPVEPIHADFAPENLDEYGALNEENTDKR